MTIKNNIPRHRQISDWIRNKIRSGEFTESEKLPSEYELSEMFGVSRVTVRRALQTLEAEGSISRSQGLGSFVEDISSLDSLVKLTDFNEDMLSAGITPSSEIIKFEQMESPKWLSDKLGLNAGTIVTQIDRVRMGDGKPVAFDMTWLPVFYGQLLVGRGLREKTIYRILEKEFGIPIVRGSYRIEAENADDYLAEHLGVKEGMALLLIDRLSLTIKDKPVYYQKRFYRCDRVVYEIVLERKDDSEDTHNMPLRELSPKFKNQD